MPASTASNETFDLCVIGAGPVGMALALESAARGLSVVLLDAGGDADDPAASDASRAEMVDPARHVPMDLAVRRGVGGASWLWGGRCVPFDEVDFAKRDFVPDSGWPISGADVDPHYRAAVRYLDCGDAVFDETPPNWRDAAGDLLASRLEHFAKQHKRALDLRGLIAAQSLIELRVEEPVTGLDLGPRGDRVVGVLVGANARPRALAKKYALACGGLETTRLLLATQQKFPRAFGGVDGPLGRYYMGHFEGSVASVVFDAPGDIDDFDYRLDATGGYVRRVLTIAGETQTREKIQNIAFWPDNLPFYDARHRSGVKSLIFLLAGTPRLGPKLVSEAIRLGIVGPAPRRFAPHVWNVLSHPFDTAREVWGVVHDRFVQKRRKPGWLLRAPDNKYVFHYRAEQMPRRDSRVTLCDERDEYGMPRLRVDLRYTAEDATRCLRAHDVVDKALRANGKGRLEYAHPEGERVARVLEQASDGYHQLGCARMGSDPATSVVDADCRVHDVDNLYLATSAVFPTGGHANPTLLATAMAARLAAHVAAKANARDGAEAARSAA